MNKNIDSSVSPKADFYDYACGGWRKAHPLPADKARYGTFDVLREKSREQVRELIEGLGNDPEAKVRGTVAQKVNDIYRQALDMERRDREGAEPLRPFIRKLDSFRPDERTRLIAWMHHGLASPFFGIGVGPDMMDSSMNILYVGEVGLGLGDRDYYLEDDDNMLRIRAAYEVYIKRILELAGYDEAIRERAWKTLIKLETDFARHKMTREDRRDPMKRYNMMTFKEIKERWDFVDWDEYFRLRNIPMPEKANISSPAFLDFINTYLPTLTDEEIHDYMLICIVDGATALLSDDFEIASFELYGKVMSGVEEREPLWKRAMAIPGSMFGEAVGELYVKKYFPEENKRYMLEMVENLRSALGEHIDALTWMSAETKARAREKLASFGVKIGYPDKWKDYSEIDIDPEKSYQENVFKASLWFIEDALSKLGKPVDREEWHMFPQTVNAYYSPQNNEICFPAGILQPPYFDPKADDASNYGAIGVVIGHEMTHGFDDSGRKFDKDGNLNEWWTAEDAEKFNALADRLVAQFDAVEVAPGVHANGRFTLGENIADQGGLRLALTALSRKNTPQPHNPTTPQHHHLTTSQLQQFYLAYAGVWADNIREEEILSRTKSDPHSLGRWRVNATLRNISEFFDAFGIKEGDPMFRAAEERVIVW